MATQQSTVATLYAPKPLTEMDRDDKLRACYQHACLKYAVNQEMSNATFRQRLGLPDRSYHIASRIITAALDGGWIRLANSEERSNRYEKYLPAWA